MDLTVKIEISLSEETKAFISAVLQKAVVAPAPAQSPATPAPAAVPTTPKPAPAVVPSAVVPPAPKPIPAPAPAVAPRPVPGPPPAPRPAPAPTPAAKAAAVQPVPEAKPVHGEDVTIDSLRKLIGAKVADNREAIKAKLSEFGVPNVSSLAPESYHEMYLFLMSL